MDQEEGERVRLVRPDCGGQLGYSLPSVAGKREVIFLKFLPKIPIFLLRTLLRCECGWLSTLPFL